MKTVIHCKDLYLSKTETWVYGQISNLKRYRPIVYCDCLVNLNAFPTKLIRLFKSKGVRSNVLIRYINKIMRRLRVLFYFVKDQPLLIHAHYGDGGYNWLRYKRFFKLPLITTFYGYDLNMLVTEDSRWKQRYAELFKFGERFLVEGNHMKNCLAELGCPKEKIIVQHLGINLDAIKFVSRKPNGNNIKILVAGSFREKKGIPYAIEAVGRVKDKCSDLKLTLTIIGDSTGKEIEEEEKKKILEKIDKSRLANCTTMLGYQPYSVLIKEFYNHHIFLSPSVTASNNDIEGGAPVSIIEASASGMPVISTTHCDIPEVIINNKSGYLVPERDVDALAERLEFLARYPSLWEKMGLLGRRHIEQNYDVKKQVEILEGIYDMTSNGKRKIKQNQ